MAMPVDHRLIACKPLTPKRWADFVKLFSEPGVQNGCWCMYWRMNRKDFYRNFGRGNRAAMKKIVSAGIVPGIIAYHKSQPVGWCSVAPREHYPSLDRSPVLKRIDDKPVWSITCFFISKPYRGRGMNQILIKAAAEYVRKHGGRIIEAYPVREEKSNVAIKWELYTGLASTFKRLGFVTVSERSKVRVVMRYHIG